MRILSKRCPVVSRESRAKADKAVRGARDPPFRGVDDADVVRASDGVWQGVGGRRDGRDGRYIS